MKKLGKWGWEVLKELGVPLAVEALKKAAGFQKLSTVIASESMGFSAAIERARRIRDNPAAGKN